MLESFPKSILFFSLFMFWDMFQISINGIVKSIGGQFAAMNIVIASQFLFGVPLSYFCGVYLGYGNQGLFIGIALGNVIISYQFCKLIIKTDWELIVQEA